MSLLGKMTIMEAFNGQQALEIYSEQSQHQKFFDVIFMDINMPVMDGLETTIKIREIESKQNYKKTIIIAVTAYSTEEEISKCKSAGMDTHVAKPVSVDTLINVLQNVLYKELGLINFTTYSSQQND